MRDVTRRRLQTLKNTVQFFTDNAVDFPNTSLGHTKFTALAAIVADCDAAAAEAASGESAMTTDTKAGAREDLADQGRQISDTAKGMEPEFPGIGPALHLKRGLNDADLIARCQAIHTASAEYETALVSYGLDAAFRDHLTDAIAAFQNLVTGQAAAVDSRVEANATLEAKVAEGMQLKRTLHAIVTNKYNGNPGKIAAWHSASHVESAPKKPKTPPTPPTP